jgi:RHS repeat-associated protein
MLIDSSEGTTKTYYFQLDDLNTVHALLDHNGTAVERYDYSAYGETRILDSNGQTLMVDDDLDEEFDLDQDGIIDIGYPNAGNPVTPRVVATQSQFDNPFGYAGMRRDEHTGLYHTHYREYNPNLGRWLTPDPAGYQDGQNLYCYYPNVNGVDLLGLLGDYQPGMDILEYQAQCFQENSEKWEQQRAEERAYLEKAQKFLAGYHNSLSAPHGASSFNNFGLSSGQQEALIAYYDQHKPDEGVFGTIGDVNYDKLWRETADARKFAAFAVDMWLMTGGPAGMGMGAASRSGNAVNALKNTRIAKADKSLNLNGPRINPERQLPGPSVPEYHVNNFSEGYYVNRQVNGGEVFYKYHGINNRTGKTHNYLTNRIYTAEEELRNDLAILEEWGIAIDRVTIFKPSKGTWISEGTAARKVGGVTEEIRAGGGYQGLIDVHNLPNSTVIRTDMAPWARKR